MVCRLAGLTLLRRRATPTVPTGRFGAGTAPTGRFGVGTVPTGRFRVGTVPTGRFGVDTVPIRVDLGRSICVSYRPHHHFRISQPY